MYCRIWEWFYRSLSNYDLQVLGIRRKWLVHSPITVNLMRRTRVSECLDRYRGGCFFLDDTVFPFSSFSKELKAYELQYSSPHLYGHMLFFYRGRYMWLSRLSCLLYSISSFVSVKEFFRVSIFLNDLVTHSASYAECFKLMWAEVSGIIRRQSTTAVPCLLNAATFEKNRAHLSRNPTSISSDLASAKELVQP